MSPASRPIDADNHYYESLDAFTRHLDSKFKRRGVQVVKNANHTEILIGERVNAFIPNPTFDPVIVPGCLDFSSGGRCPRASIRGDSRRSSPSRVPTGTGMPAWGRWTSRDWKPRCSSLPSDAGLSRLSDDIPGDDGQPPRFQPLARGGLGLLLSGSDRRRADALARRPRCGAAEEVDYLIGTAAPDRAHPSRPGSRPAGRRGRSLGDPLA